MNLFSTKNNSFFNKKQLVKVAMVCSENEIINGNLDFY